MINQQQFIDSAMHEFKVLQHLYTKILPGTFDYRPTPGQRSTLELLRYLSTSSQTMTELIKKGDGGGREAFEAAAKSSADMTAEEFPAKLEAERQKVEELLRSFTEAELAEEVDLWGTGMKQPRSMWLLNSVLKNLTGYKMQLFLYIKASGNSEIGTSNLWQGRDAAKPQG